MNFIMVRVRRIALVQLAGYPFNSYDFFDTWGRGEDETRHVVSTHCAVGLNVHLFCQFYENISQQN